MLELYTRGALCTYGSFVSTYLSVPMAAGEFFSLVAKVVVMVTVTMLAVSTSAQLILHRNVTTRRQRKTPRHALSVAAALNQYGHSRLIQIVFFQLIPMNYVVFK